jgi:hypothetical protein
MDLFEMAEQRERETREVLSQLSDMGIGFGEDCPRHGGNENSIAANDSIQQKRKAQIHKIEELIRIQPRCLHDLETALGLAANHFSGRLSFLKEHARIVIIGKCTHGRSGGAIYGPRGER